jgi:hypothetical protein
LSWPVMSVNLRRVVFWVGLALYAASFAMVALQDMGGTKTGFQCAEISILMPIILVKDSLRGAHEVTHDALEAFSIFMVALINPLFLVWVVVSSFQKHARSLLVLKIALLSMIPFCWIIFAYRGMHPREGHFLWIVGMLLVLFSGTFGTSARTRVE